MKQESIFRFRYMVSEEDKINIQEILESSGFFYDFEIDVAVELVDEAVKSGEGSGYHFVFAEIDCKTVGYTCFGDIPCTKNSYDIFWIAVHQNQRGSGLGGLILLETERIIKEMGGNGVYLETSGREKYLPTRNFYLKHNYVIEAEIKDFYDYGDDKVLFAKRLNPLSPK